MSGDDDPKADERTTKGEAKESEPAEVQATAIIRGETDVIIGTGMLVEEDRDDA